MTQLLLSSCLQGENAIPLRLSFLICQMWFAIVLSHKVNVRSECLKYFVWCMVHYKE